MTNEQYAELSARLPLPSLPRGLFKNQPAAEQVNRLNSSLTIGVSVESRISFRARSR